jgi:hypothetical protein
MQWQHSTVIVSAWPSGGCFDSEIVGEQGDGAAVGHPLLQFRVASVERRGGGEQHLPAGPVFHVEQHSRETGADADEVAGLDDHLVLVHHHHLLVADDLAGAATMSLRVDHHGANLHAGDGHVLDASPRAPEASPVADWYPLIS